MKFYSEKVNKVFDTQEDCLKAEKDYEDEKAKKELAKKQKDEARAARAKEVEEAFNAMMKAKDHYTEILNAFVHDYGAFHMTVKDVPGNGFLKLFDDFWF